MRLTTKKVVNFSRNKVNTTEKILAMPMLVPFMLAWSYIWTLEISNLKFDDRKEKARLSLDESPDIAQIIQFPFENNFW